MNAGKSDPPYRSRMARFFFHVRDSEHVEDTDGLLLFDMEQARREAVRGARSLVSESVLAGRLNLEGRIDVEDEVGLLLFSVSYRYAVGLA